MYDIRDDMVAIECLYESGLIEADDLRDMRDYLESLFIESMAS